jgi:hypothetical protein
MTNPRHSRTRGSIGRGLHSSPLGLARCAIQFRRGAGNTGGAADDERRPHSVFQEALPVPNLHPRSTSRDIALWTMARKAR